MKYIQANKEQVKQNALKRDVKDVDVDHILDLNQAYLNIKSDLQELRIKRNKLSKDQKENKNLDSLEEVKFTLHCIL